MIVFCAWATAHPAVRFGTLYTGDRSLAQADALLAGDGCQDADADLLSLAYSSFRSNEVSICVLWRVSGEGSPANGWDEPRCPVKGSY